MGKSTFRLGQQLLMNLIEAPVRSWTHQNSTARMNAVNRLRLRNHLLSCQRYASKCLIPWGESFLIESALNSIQRTWPSSWKPAASTCFSAIASTVVLWELPKTSTYAD